MSRVTKFGLAAMVPLVGLMAYQQSQHQQSKQVASSGTAERDCGEHEKLATDMLSKRVFTRIDGRSAYVDGVFHSLAVEDKQRFTRALALRQQCYGSSPNVLLKSHATGKLVGAYSHATGLEMK